MQRMPNVVLINCDDMGYGDLGCYGSEQNDTPFIDQLAKEGVLMTSCYAASPVCSPSRASLMTGSYPARCGINRVLFPRDPLGLNPNEYTIANMFQDHGYKSMIVGKWHCGDQKEFLPMEYGFDGYYGLPYSNDMGRQVGRENGTTYPPLPLIDGDEVIQEQPDQRALTERYVEQCVRFVRKNKDNPFFLYFAHMHVHLPLYANARFEEESRNGDFGACMAEVDWACHAVVEELKKQGIYEDTLIIFTSDNGSRAADGASNGTLRGTKLYTWEGGLRVPCIFHWKGRLSENMKIDHMCSHLDFLPLLAHIIGAKLPEELEIDGMDIYDTIFHNKPVRQEFAYYGCCMRTESHSYLCALRKGDWKMHNQMVYWKKVGGFAYQPKTELYNLKTDIGETRNVYDEYPEIVAEFQTLFAEYRERLGDANQGGMGRESRLCGRVAHPVTLTTYHENHPYITALYDKEDQG